MDRLMHARMVKDRDLTFSAMTVAVCLFGGFTLLVISLIRDYLN